MVSQKDSKKVVENKLKFALRSYILYNMKGLSPLNKPWAMVFQTLLKDLSLEELEHTRTCFEIIDNKLKKGEIPAKIYEYCIFRVARKSLNSSLSKYRENHPNMRHP